MTDFLVRSGNYINNVNMVTKSIRTHTHTHTHTHVHAHLQAKGMPRKKIILRGMTGDGFIRDCDIWNTSQRTELLSLAEQF